MIKEEQIKKDFIGKKILNIISLNIEEANIKSELKKICDNDYSDINSAKLILMEGSEAFVFVDFDCDGYRSGQWNFIKLKNVLDKGNTEGIKKINSKINNIEFFENKSGIKDYSEDCSGVLITTDDYIIKMGQNNNDSYYPSNFFDVEECKSFALGEAELIK